MMCANETPSDNTRINDKETLENLIDKTNISDNQSSDYYQYQLNTNWTFWVHLPHDTNWTIESYKKVYNIDYIEEAIGLVEQLEERLVVNCMLFLMRQDILPMWEDPANLNGGCISYKIGNHEAYLLWKSMCYAMVGETLTDNDELQAKIMGLTISPKKNFCIIKIWVNACDESVQDPKSINNIDGVLGNYEGIFKKHIQ